MALVVDETTFYGVLIGLVILLRIINSQGGPKIVVWRVLGIRWFLHAQRQADGNTIRKALPWKVIKTHSLPSYTFRGKDWFVGGPKETARIYGGPQWVYNYNDARPLPLEHGDYEKTGGPIDGAVIHSAFENKTIEAFNQLNRKPERFKWGMMALVLVLAMMAAILSAYYSYYFGVNVNCAVHSRACP